MINGVGFYDFFHVSFNTQMKLPVISATMTLTHMMWLELTDNYYSNKKIKRSTVGTGHA